MLSKVYGESTRARSKLYEWPQRFKEGRESIEYNKFFGLPSISRNAKNVVMVSKCVKKDCHQAKKLLRTATAGSDVVQSGRPIFDDFNQHLWPYIGNNTANVVFQMVKRLWLIRIDQ
ncbi:hypothetical protein TNCV_3021391 [Trichonephila clavipes]|nr:hypothetical protein TNCV_3021391 [Trichonephila clavipes]